MKRKVLILITVLITLNGYSQIDLSEPDRINCGTAIVHNKRLAEDPSLQLLINKQNKWAKDFAKNHTSNKSGTISYIIPVVYHIIHNNGPENVSTAVIEASVKNLNDDFQKINTDINQVVSAFTGIAADIEIEFRLAHLDPNGNCTEGITRTVSTETYAMTENSKNLVNWNTSKYLNIWVGQTMKSGSGGWSYYPGTAPSQNNEGIVVRSSQLGNTITHEVGHFLNLPHVWGSSNSPGGVSNCSIDDGVGDTPFTEGNTSCNVNTVSCGTLDNVQNYMDYSGCSRMFTEGQKTRMHAALNIGWGSRNNLWTQTNLNSTGVNNPYSAIACAPLSAFSYDKKNICEGGSVTFTDNSYNGIPTTFNWTFTGGTPTVSPLRNPTIVYNTAGIYDVTYQPSNATGSNSKTKTSIITVSSLSANYQGAVVSDFENVTTYNNEWIENSNEGVAWERTSAASVSGSHSVRIRNNQTTNDGDTDELISPSFNIASVSAKTMTFKQAFAQKNSTNTDRLIVNYSIDCGQTWLFAKIITSSILS